MYIKVSAGRAGRKLIPSGQFIAPEHWNQSRQVVRKSCPNREGVEQALRHKRSEIEQLLLELQDKYPALTIAGFAAYLDGKSLRAEVTGGHVTFFDALEVHFDRMKATCTEDTLKDIRTLKKYLRAYEAKTKCALTWDSMNYSFYESFVHFLSTQLVKRNGEVGLAKNTVGKVINNLKNFLNKSMNRNYCPDIKLSQWKVMTEKVDHVYLDEQELEKVWNKDFSSDPEHELIRDVFIFGCETGLRISDFSADLSIALKQENQNLITYVTQKTKKKVIIPVTPRLAALIEKFNGSYPTVSKNKFNIEIKEVLRLSGIDKQVQITRTQGGKSTTNYHPKYKLVSSHTCRRSFATNAYLRGIPPAVIQQVTGHTTEKTLMRYIKADAHEAADRILREWGLGD